MSTAGFTTESKRGRANSQQCQTPRFRDGRNLCRYGDRVDIHTGSCSRANRFAPAHGKGIERSRNGRGCRRGDLDVKERIGGHDRTATVERIADGQRGGAVKCDPVIESVSRASRENYGRGGR